MVGAHVEAFMAHSSIVVVVVAVLNGDALGAFDVDELDGIIEASPCPSQGGENAVGADAAS